MSESIAKGWHAHTVVKEEELREYLLSPSQTSDGRLEVRTHCIAVGGNTIDTNGLIKFASNMFPHFVFPEDEVEERFPQVYRDAQARAGFRENSQRDGLYGELLLFLLVDGLLDMPMISHKITGKQNPQNEVKGSDGVFFGEYRGKESLGIGEAKIFGDKKAGIRDSIESTDRFHGSGGGQMQDHELEVAANNLSTNLSGERLVELSERLTSNSSSYQIIHPIFVGYEEDELNRIQEDPIDGDELEERLFSFIEEDEDMVPYIQEKLEEYQDLRKHWLVFFLLPVEDSDVFKEQMKEKIYPQSTG